MSGTLLARRKPKSNWPWHFKMTIRDKLHVRFNGGIIPPSAVEYLEGLRDAASDEDADTLDYMIEALNEGDEIEFKLEY